MKKIISLTNLLLFILCLSSSAQEVLYIFENTGKMNAFYSQDIDSITHSKRGIDGKEYDDYVTQLVHLKDSTYLISIADIDSVSLRKPETILHSDVYMLTDAHLPYIVKSEDMSLYFKEALPQELRPSVGQIIVLKPFTSSVVEYGFTGKVESITFSGDEMAYNCSEVSFEDIYEQIVEFGTSGDEAHNELRSSWKDIDWSLPVDYEKGPIKFAAAFSGKLSYTYYTRKLRGDDHSYLKLETINKKSLSVTFSPTCEGGANDFIGPMKTFARVPLGTTPFFFEFSLTGFYDVKGSASLDIKYENSSKDVVIVEYNDGKWSANKSSNGNQSGAKEREITAKVAFKGSAHMGIYADFYIGLPNSSCGAGLGLYLGPKFQAQIEPVDFLNLPPSFYSSFKDAEIGVNWLSVKAELELRANFFKKWSWKLVTTPELNLFPFTFHLVPEFSGFQSEKEENNTTLTYDVKRHLLYPVTLGTRVYDGEKKNLVNEQYKSNFYWFNPVSNVEYSYTLASGQAYKAVPSFKFRGINIPIDAEPELDINDLPASLISVTQEDYFYNSNGYDLGNGSKSNFKISALINTQLTECKGQIQGWGIVYYLPNDEKYRIPIQKFDAGSYSVRLTIPSDAPDASVTAGIYVVYANGKEEFGEPATYALKYPERVDINLLNASFSGNSANVTFEGENYSHRSSFIYSISVSGAYWLTKQGAMEKGSGWSGWNVGHKMINPCDGKINLTVNYHYNDKNFNGDYNVVAYGLNKSGSSHESIQTARLSHNGEVFTGCTFVPNSTINASWNGSGNNLIVVKELSFGFEDSNDLENNCIININ